MDSQLLWENNALMNSSRFVAISSTFFVHLFYRIFDVWPLIMLTDNDIALKNF